MIIFDFIVITVVVLIIYVMAWIIDPPVRRLRPARKKIPQGTPFDIESKFTVDKYMRDKIDVTELELELDRIAAKFSGVSMLEYELKRKADNLHSLMHHQEWMGEPIDPKTIDWIAMRDGIDEKARLWYHARATKHNAKLRPCPRFDGSDTEY